MGCGWWQARPGGGNGSVELCIIHLCLGALGVRGWVSRLQDPPTHTQPLTGPLHPPPAGAGDGQVGDLRGAPLQPLLLLLPQLPHLQVRAHACVACQGSSGQCTAAAELLRRAGSKLATSLRTFAPSAEHPTQLVLTCPAMSLTLHSCRLLPPTRTHLRSCRPFLPCRTPQEFSRHLEYALANEPHPMSSDEVQRLTWDAATERFLDVAELKPKDLRPGPLASAMDGLLWATHNTLTGGCGGSGGRGATAAASSGGLAGAAPAPEWCAALCCAAPAPLGCAALACVPHAGAVHSLLTPAAVPYLLPGRRHGAPACGGGRGSQHARQPAAPGGL